jgi:hypothetical protein
MGQDLNHITRRCERAVVTAYRALRQAGTDEVEAFRNCASLYRYHHPEASEREARLLVAEWIEHHIVQGRRTPTEGCACD